MTDFVPTTDKGLLTLWDFNKASTTTVEDQAPKGGLENGTLMGDAETANGVLSLDGKGDYMVAQPDQDWQDLSEGRVELVFNQADHVGSSPDTLLSRDSQNNDDGGHLNIEVTKNGAVEVRHQDETDSFFYKTPKDFFSEGDDVRVTYAWDSDGEDGFFKVENLSTGAVYEEDIDDQLTLDNGSTSEPFTVGAGQTVSGDNTANNLNEYFNGEIAYVAIFDSAAVAAPETADPDFIVSGTDGADVIDVSYDGDPEGDMIDANDNQTGSNEDVVDAGAGDDVVEAGAADDTVFAGSGDDSVLGEGGDDVIFGDTSLGTAGPATVRESFEWDELGLSDGDTVGSTTQDTGNVNVTFTVNTDSGVNNEYETTDQNVDGIDSGSETINANGSFESVLNGQSNDATYTFDFDAAVQNVSFRVNDIDGDGIVRVTAIGPDGPVEVELTAGSNLTQTDDNTVDSNGGYEPDSSANYSVLVEIPGPLTSITIEHDQDGPNNSGINITEVFFDAPVDVPDDGPGDDTLEGGAGDDLIYGETGDDSIDGNSGDDTLFGDDPAEGTPIGPNLILNGSFEDTTGMTPTGYGFVGNGEIPGWTDANGEEIDVHNDDRGGVLPTDGDNWLDLEASPGNNLVGQDVAGVQDGETYLLTFDAGDRTGEPQSGPGENLINVYWGGELVGTVDPDAGPMQSFEFELIGGAGDGSNRLEFEGTGDPDNFGASVDSVSLVLVAGPEGEGGNDTIDGGTGDDLIAGQDGSDVLSGDDGDDTLTGGSGDQMTGGSGDDTFIIDVTEEDESGSIASDFSVDGSTEGTDNDTLDLSVYEAFRNLNETEDGDDVPSTSGTVEVQNADGDWITVTFAEIENLILPPAAPDGVVDGEDFAEVMNVGYNDANAPTDGGGDQITLGDDSIEGNGGDDTISAGAGDDTVDGGADDDFIEGDLGDDSIIGGEGNDSLFGGSGDDTLEGGEGDDLIVTGNFNGTQPVGDPTSGDTTSNSNVADGGAGNDTILASVGGDTLLGGTGDDSILGNRGEDDLQGGDGSDTLDGQDGSDSLDGGDGDDDIVVGSGDQAMGGSGDDEFTVDTAVTGDDPITIVGGETGEDLSDPTNGGDGDILDLTGLDIVSLVYDPTDPTFDPATGVGESGTVVYNNDAGDPVTLTFSEIENVVHDPLPNGVVDGEEFGEIMGPGYDDSNGPTDGGGDIIDGPDGLDDVIEGNGGDDTIDAGLGDDTVRGGTGNDEIDGNEGSDLLVGGLGDDTVEGGAGDDELRGNEGNDVIDGGDGNDSMGGAEGEDTLTGGDGEDTLSGGSGNDVLDGGADDDTIRGNSGNDEITDLDGDNLIFGGTTENNDGAPDVGLPFLGFPDADPGNDLDTITTGDGNDTIYAGDDNDVIDAGDGDNFVDGGFDDDSITTGDGNDEIIGGEGDDTIVAGDGDDTITGGVGLDSVNIPDDGSDPTFPGPDPLPADDPLLSNGNDLIDAGGGNDFVLGEDDDDTIFGGEGNDTLDGGIDEDSIFGDEGDDSIIGGQGDDSLYGGSGDDTIEGGEGDDLIVTGNFNGTQPVGDPTSGDTTASNNIADGGAGDDTILGSIGDDTLLGGEGNDSVIGNRGDDNLQGGDGNDTLDGQGGSDIIDGGDGDDDITVNAGDTATGGGGDDEFVVSPVGPGDDPITVIGGETDEEDVIDPTNNPGGRIGDTLDLSGVNLQTLVYDPTDPTFDPVTGVGESGTATFLNNQGDLVTLDFAEIENVIPCFTPGAMIATPTGEKPVESLREGDKVITRDNGIQEIRWVGQRTLNRDELARAPQMRPIRIKAGSLGDNLPERDMIVSPQHRVLVSGERTQLYFDESEVLVAAKHLVNGGGIQKLETLRTTYVHFMFDQHEVVLSDGAWTESFQPGDQSLGSMGRAARDEILALFPELASTEGRGAYAAARRSLKAHEARLLQL